MSWRIMELINITALWNTGRDLVKGQITLCKNNIDVVICQKQKLHHFCNRSSLDDGPKSGQKVLGIHRTMDNM